jgi:hypothetical protein
MSIDIYKTHTMLAAVKQMAPVTSFLRDRYFPTGSGDLFPTEEVLVEYKDATGNKMAPVVLPRKGSISVERDGYSTERMAPPLIAPSRPLTIDDLNKKGFGEDLFSGKTPAQRQAEILVQDLEDFDKMLTTREEYIAAQCIFNNGYDLKQYADKYGSGEAKEYELRFYGAEGNSAVYAPSVMWSNATDADIFGDLHTMIRMLTTKGNNATEVLLGSDVADVLMKNEKIQKLMDLSRYNVGEIAPVALPQGAARLGRLNIRGRMIDLLTYDGTYIDEETGNVEFFIPAKKIAVTAPGAGRGLYGAVTQMEQADGQWHTYMGRRVPRYWAEKDGRELTVSSRPLFVPKTKDCFISAEVLG